MRHGEFHRIQRSGWLRAAVLGANDGVISTASLMMGVAGAQGNIGTLMLTGIAGLVAGALSMAAGEYVSVRSQADTEQADLAREREELATQPEAELRELTEIYVHRGLDRQLALQVATQLMAKDALGAHARDELGITEVLQARPWQAAFSSALSFALGAALPTAAAVVGGAGHAIATIGLCSLVALACLGALAARIGDANPWRGAWRVCTWGALAMGITSLIGHWSGALL